MDHWRQLDLLKGKRQKGTLPPGPTERQIHITLVRMLKQGCMAKGWRFFHPANGEYRTEATAGLLKDMGVMPGVSDLIFFGPPAATLHALEIKRKGMKPSLEQRAFIESVLAAGGKACWVDSVDQAVDVLQEWGAIRFSLRS